MFEKSRLLTCQILGLLVNTLPTDEKYPVFNRDNLTVPIQIQLSQKPKTFSEFFLAFFKSRLIFEYFRKKRDSQGFRISELRSLKTGLHKSLKSPFSENLSTRNMVNVPKHCWNLHHSTFIIFIDHCQGNWYGKSLSYWYAISWDCLLTHWLQVKSILFFIGPI